MQGRIVGGQLQTEVVAPDCLGYVAGQEPGIALIAVQGCTGASSGLESDVALGRRPKSLFGRGGKPASDRKTVTVRFLCLRRYVRGKKDYLGELPFKK